MRPAAGICLTLVLVAACGDAPALAHLTTAVTESPHVTSTGTAEVTSESGAQATETSTGTGEAGTGETTQAPDSSGQSSTGPDEPVLPPKLREATLTPTVIEVEGPIAAHALAEHASGVRMRVDGGDPIELDEVAPGEFAGEVGVFTALSNGTHEVVFTAWTEAAESVPRTVAYEVKLQAAGSEAFWDASGVLGAGFGRGVAVDRVDGSVYELFEVTTDEGDRCFVRRRGSQGEYAEADLSEVLPGKNCTATAITAAEDGTLHVLVEAELNGSKVWWLGRKDGWGGPMLTLAWGGPGEKAYALAQHREKAEVAVCGTTPTSETDLVDGMVAIFRQGMPGYRPPPFDYKPYPNDEPHGFGETLHDCAYAEDVLVLAGEAYGGHPGDMKEYRNHLLLIEYDTQTDAAHWTVAGIGPGLAVQSGARALTITDGGTYLTFGYACEDPCEQQLHLREFLPGGVPTGWNVLPAVNAALATDISWSPAGYAIISAAKVNGPWWTEFWLQGWVPGDDSPVWSYGHLDQPSLHIAMAIATAKFGRIYVVGVAGVNGIQVPALAIIDP